MQSPQQVGRCLSLAWSRESAPAERRWKRIYLAWMNGEKTVGQDLEKGSRISEHDVRSTKSPASHTGTEVVMRREGAPCKRVVKTGTVGGSWGERQPVDDSRRNVVGHCPTVSHFYVYVRAAKQNKTHPSTRPGLGPWQQTRAHF